MLYAQLPGDFSFFSTARLPNWVELSRFKLPVETKRRTSIIPRVALHTNTILLLFPSLLPSIKPFPIGTHMRKLYLASSSCRVLASAIHTYQVIKYILDVGRCHFWSSDELTTNSWPILNLLLPNYLPLGQPIIFSCLTRQKGKKKHHQLSIKRPELDRLLSTPIKCKYITTTLLQTNSGHPFSTLDPVGQTVRGAYTRYFIWHIGEQGLVDDHQSSLRYPQPTLSSGKFQLPSRG